MTGTEKAGVAFLTLLILTIVAVTALVIGNYVNRADEHAAAPVSYVTVVMEKKAQVTAVFEDESIYSEMRELQKKKLERNRRIIPVIEEKEKQKEEYIKRRKNWIRYVDGELIKGYDPRYDNAFDSNSILIEYRG